MNSHCQLSILKAAAIVVVLSVYGCGVEEDHDQIITIKIEESQLYGAGESQEDALSTVKGNGKDILLIGECAYGNLEGSEMKVVLAQEVTGRVKTLSERVGLDPETYQIVRRVVERRVFESEDSKSGVLFDENVVCR